MTTAPLSTIRRGALTAAVSAVALLCLTGRGEAAELSAAEAPGEPNRVALDFRAAAGEDNQVAVTTIAKDDGYLTLNVVDSGATIVVGPGCSGGGAPGAAATCRVHEPRSPQFQYGLKTVVPVPGTGWDASMRIDLGDGDNSFDGSSFSGVYGDRFDISVRGGSGEDVILTGGGEDTLDPGAGRDQLHTGEGYDRVEATAVDDGEDLYDLGKGIDEVSYQRRGARVFFSDSTAGAKGENDTLTGVEYVLGGDGDDVLEGGSDYDRLEGGPGDDILTGDAGNDELRGGTGNDAMAGADGRDRVIGEAGNDISYGGPGHDVILDQDRKAEPGFTPNYEGTESTAGGIDVAHGDEDDDVIELGAGPDRVFGGPGDDDLVGSAGNDLLNGGKGDDALVGGTGYDRLLGTSGNDRLYSGRTRWNVPDPLFSPEPDDGADLTECGPGRDVAAANPWDRVSRCETVRVLRPRRG